ncbi:HTH-type transcriptional regulator MalT [Falsiruegeria litorea R37]|uniref:HTH-type transcriptional regulator MalT n=1 Tax=Falsiruegeria litorea R37 TaxID=1200284 RepID=A0A1Y5SVH6_9RHOB|nr:LuxR family transcriptional regulator [Falsiruegeria litorea]SLN47946.1 HTH-type transcriptional regulator MalT [Falsiruegeria litorea R37]
MKPISEFALELLDQLSQLFSDQDRWDFVVSSLKNMGFNALNMGCFSPTTGVLKWSRSSMSAEWLEEYSSGNYSDEDPLFAQVTNGIESLYVKSEERALTANSPKSSGLYNGLKASGYMHLFSLVVPCPGDEAKIVVLSSDRPDAEQTMTDHAREMRILATVIATNLGPETSEDESSVVDLGPILASSRPLSKREQQVLALLSEGLRNDQISDLLGIKEITVRTHIKSARDKLGAATREAALVRAVQMGLIAPEYYRKR